MTIFSDFECGNAKNIKRVAERHYRLEAIADNAQYCYYFQFAVRNTGEAAPARIEVLPDSSVTEAARSFQSHFPFTVWLRRAGSRHWETLPLLRNQEEILRIDFMLQEDETLLISRTLPFPFSEIESWVNEFSAEHPGEVERVSLGTSVEGRDLAGLRVRALCEKPRPFLVVAGQHPAEFAGVRALRGAAEFLVSRLKEAREAREKFEFFLFPSVNPDGNVEGKNAFNAEGADLYRSFEGCAAGSKAAAREAQLLWDWIEKKQPVALLNFHSYAVTVPGGDFPWEGAYVPPEDVFPDEASRQRQQVVNDYLRFKTDGLSQHSKFSIHVPQSLEYNLAQRGIVSAFYEVQDSMGAHRNSLTGLRVLHAVSQALEQGVMRHQSIH